LTLLRTVLTAFLLALVAGPAHAADATAVPEFRHVSRADVSASLRQVRSIRFALKEASPPFAYRNASGELTGLLPLVLNGVCADLKVNCEFFTQTAGDLEALLQDGQADAIVAFSVPDAGSHLDRFDHTRPFLRSFSRFAARVGSPINDAGRRALAGKRIGVRTGTRQAQFLAQYYPRSAIVEFDDTAGMYEALRLAHVDAIFEDSFRLMFWLQGKDAKGCCTYLGGGFGIGTELSQAVSLQVRKADIDLRKVLDYGLDRMQSSGRFAAIYARFFPESPL
jgi:polar amino acid transport system substrate-binding protein